MPAPLMYFSGVSLDNYREDADGDFSWGAPSEEVHLMVAPVVLGGGVPYLDGGIRLGLELLDERRFANGSMYLRYAVRR